VRSSGGSPSPLPRYHGRQQRQRRATTAYSCRRLLTSDNVVESELKIRKEADGDMVHRRIFREVRPPSFLRRAKDSFLQAGFGVNFCVRTLLNQPWRYLDLDCRGPLGSAPAAPDHGALVPMLLKRRMWLWA
jgi:hypothetical protein